MVVGEEVVVIDNTNCCFSVGEVVTFIYGDSDMGDFLHFKGKNGVVQALHDKQFRPISEDELWIEI